MAKKVVLEEDQYVEALERIIERDFFPDLPNLRAQHECLDSDGATLDAESVATTAPRSNTKRHVRTPVVETASDSSSWDQLTPSRGPGGERSAVNDSSVGLSHKRTGDERDDRAESVRRLEDMTLDRFVATHTSEDNAAFTELQEKAVEDHKRRYHWAYDDDGGRGDAKLHLLTNGEWISQEQRLIVDQVLAPEGDKDTRPTAPDTWPFRARNALLFVPDLQASNQICKVGVHDSAPLLENEDRAEGTRSRAVIMHDPSTGVSRSRGKRETVYANSRFQASTHETAESEAVGGRPRKNVMELVQMTPQIAPGVDASPLMTWGDIEGTPMILDPRANPDQVLNGPRFVVKESSTREKIASRLESQSRMHKSHQQTPTPLIRRGKRASELATPSRAESIRSRLSSMRSTQRTPLFGSNSELRASYATPLLPPRDLKPRVTKK